MESSNKERNVYEYKSVVKVMDYRISAIDVHGNYLIINPYIDCVMVIGSEKGYIYPYDIMTDLKTKQVWIANILYVCNSKHLIHKMRVEREAQPRLIS